MGSKLYLRVKDLYILENKLDDIDESEVEKVISCSYECDGLIMLSKFDDDFYTIEDDDYEICLTLDQMQFLMESFNRIKDKKIK